MDAGCKTLPTYVETLGDDRDTIDGECPPFYTQALGLIDKSNGHWLCLYWLPNFLYTWRASPLSIPL
jgi:hypothetical protein